jgi:GxxExxY protein
MVNASEEKQYPHRDTTDKIIAAAIEVHRVLGPGFVEAVYQAALAHELQLRGVAFERERPIAIVYKSQAVGEHRLDFLVEGVVIVETKAVDEINDVNVAWVLSYLKAAKLTTALIINFHKPRLKDGIRRVAL